MLSFVIAEEDLRIKTSYPFNEVTAVFLLNNPRYHHTSHSDEPLSYHVCVCIVCVVCVLYVHVAASRIYIFNDSRIHFTCCMHTLHAGKHCHEEAVQATNC